MSRILKLSQLIDANACHAQVCLFQKTFGESVEVSVELALSVYDKFDWNFAARNFISAAALAEYDKVKAPALAEYDKVKALALAEYNKVTAPAWAEYEKVEAAAWAEYEKVKASAWATAYINDNGE